MKKTVLVVSILILLLLGILQLSGLATANPYLYELDKEEVAPPSDVSPPTINIRDPENNTAFIADKVTLSFWLSYDVPLLPELFYYSLSLFNVYYEASWLENKTSLDIAPVIGSIHTERFSSQENAQKWGTDWAIKPYTVFHRFSVSLEEVPVGSHWLRVTAILVGSYETGLNTLGYPTIHYALYKLTGSSFVTFTVGNVSIVSPQNKTYETFDVPLLFEAPESTKELAYSLDGHKNVTVAGNTTLNGLSVGVHDVKVYVWDAAGNAGASETATFGVAEPEPEPEPFPTTIVLGSIIAVMAVGLGLLVYFKKRKG
jgi:hypothetical protein